MKAWTRSGIMFPNLTENGKQNESFGNGQKINYKINVEKNK
jgi:hypothetical protein